MSDFISYDDAINVLSGKDSRKEDISIEEYFKVFDNINKIYYVEDHEFWEAYDQVFGQSFRTFGEYIPDNDYLYKSKMAVLGAREGMKAKKIQRYQHRNQYTPEEYLDFLSEDYRKEFML